MTPTPHPHVLKAFDLVATHNYTARQACTTTGCSYQQLHNYIHAQGLQLSRGIGGGLASTQYQKRILAMMLVCAGHNPRHVANQIGVHNVTVYRWVHNEHMVTPAPPVAITSNTDLPTITSTDPLRVEYNPHHVKVGRGIRLTAFDRTYIHFCLNHGHGIRHIARAMGRCPSVISREITRHSVDGVYNPLVAQQQSIQSAKRPKQRKLDTNPVLKRLVVRLLNKHVSPKRIVARLKNLSDGNQDLTLSHETIYQALYVQGAGSLRHELKVDYALRSGRRGRKPKSKLPTRGRGAKTWVEGAEYSTRPAQAEDRAVPGHWEGDLVLGTLGSQHAIITLIERRSRLFMARLLTTDHTSPTVVGALEEMLADINRMATSPDRRIRTLTWDQGTEMATSKTLEDKISGLKIYFCDPHSPWQRPSNENINAELRRFIPKGTDLATVTEQQLQEYVELINDTPRVVLDGLTPREVFFNLDPTP